VCDKKIIVKAKELEKLESFDPIIPASPVRGFTRSKTTKGGESTKTQLEELGQH
jgi:hypothetical protein